MNSTEIALLLNNDSDKINRIGEIIGKKISERDNFENLNSVLVDSGCRFKKPHLIPLFLPFLALPDIRILSTGLVDVKNRSFLTAVT